MKNSSTLLGSSRYDNNDNDDDGSSSFSSSSNNNNSNSNSNSNTNTTIALFGASSKTGRCFLRLALDAGYHVRALIVVPNNNNGSRNKSNGSSKQKQQKVVPNCLQEFVDQPGVKFVFSDSYLHDTTSLETVVRNVDFVVCMPLQQDNDNDNNNVDPHHDDDANAATTLAESNYNNTKFIQTLYPILLTKKSKSIAPNLQVLLFQATSLANDGIHGTTPVLSQLLKTVLRFNTKRRHFWQDQDQVVRTIAAYHHHQQQHNDNGTDTNSNSNKNSRTSTSSRSRNSRTSTSSSSRFQKASHLKPEQGAMHTHDDDDDDDSTRQQMPKLDATPHFSFIVTRPTLLLQDGGGNGSVPSSRSVSASKSQPGLCFMTHMDLAEFSLNALLNRELYNTCPYVVAD